jgi:hypothetical protein
MRVQSIAAALVLATVFAAPAAAQRVDADVVVRSGPVYGHVEVNRPPERRVVVVERERYAPPARVIVVERWHGRGAWKHAWHRGEFRPVHLWYWDGRYYDRRFDRQGDVREVIVYERDGHYYFPDRDGHRDHDRRWDDDDD